MKVRKWFATGAAAVLVTALAACGVDEEEPGENGNGDWPEEVILGLVPSQEVDQLVEDAQVLGDLLATELGIGVDTYVPTDYAALVVAMQTGQADIGMFGPIALVQAADRAGAEIRLQSVRRGSPSYHTQWFTNNPERFCQTEVVQAENAEGNTFSYCNGTEPPASEGPAGEDALSLIGEGETVIFVDASSASGYYYPATQIASVTGIDPLSGLDAQFAGNHQSAVLAVQRGDAEVGVSFDDARNDLVEETPEIGDEVVVFAWSSEIPNDGMAIRSELPQDLRDAITDAMMRIIQTEEGAQAFLDVYNIEGLVEADLAAIDIARQVAQNFGDQ
jgi:phosphonate transport system substrate-binding protein